MSPLRARMIEDMTLAGLAPGTQTVYIQAVRRLAVLLQRLALVVRHLRDGISFPLRRHLGTVQR